MVKEDPVVGYIAVAVAVICFGSFAVPAKWASVRAANVHPLVYQTYKTFWCFATSWLALLVPGVQLVFTPFGVLSAVAWVPAGTLAIASIGYAGLGTAQATWSSMASALRPSRNAAATLTRGGGLRISTSTKGFMPSLVAGRG